LPDISRLKHAKRAGPSGLAMSRAAPVAEILRTVQSIAPPPNSIVPAFNMRCLAAIRCSSIESNLAKTRGIDSRSFPPEMLVLPIAQRAGKAGRFVG
jgi:hypothetical protein